MDSLTPFVRDPFVHAIGWALIHSLWQGTLIALLLGLALRYFRGIRGRGASSQLRYLFSCIALISVVALMIATAIYMTDTKRDSARSAIVHIDTQPVARAEPVATTALPDTSLSSTPIKPDTRMFAWVERCLPWIVSAWLAGLLLVSCRMILGWGSLRRLRHQGSTPASEALRARVAELCRVMGIKRAVVVLTTTRAAVPMVVGWARPVILLPASCLTGLSSRQLQAILAHELAHVLRHDYLFNLLQCVAETLLFYHPAVWWIGRTIRREREQCCDDRVVQLTGDRTDYARALLQLAEAVPPHRARLSLASQGGDLSGRVRRLLGREPQPTYNRWSAGLWTAMACLCVIGVFVAATLAQEKPANDPAKLIDALLAGETIERDTIEMPPPTIIDVPYQQLLSGDKSVDVVIRPGDAVNVIAAGAGGFMYIQGEISRPGAYNLPGSNDLTLKQLVVSAGGWDESSPSMFAKVVRRIGPDEEQTLHFSLNDIFDGWAQDTYLAPNDVVLISNESADEDEAALGRRLKRERIVELNRALIELTAASEQATQTGDERHRAAVKISERIESNRFEVEKLKRQLADRPDTSPLPILPSPDRNEKYRGRAPNEADLMVLPLPNTAVAGDMVNVVATGRGEGYEQSAFTRTLDKQGVLNLSGIGETPFLGRPIAEIEAAILKQMRNANAYRSTERVSVTLPNLWLFVPVYPPKASSGGPSIMFQMPQAEFRLSDALSMMRRAGDIPSDTQIIRIIRQDPIGPSMDAESNSP